MKADELTKKGFETMQSGTAVKMSKISVSGTVEEG